MTKLIYRCISTFKLMTLNTYMQLSLFVTARSITYIQGTMNSLVNKLICIILVSFMFPQLDYMECNIYNCIGTCVSDLCVFQVLHSIFHTLGQSYSTGQAYSTGVHTQSLSITVNSRLVWILTARRYQIVTYVYMYIDIAKQKQPGC